MSLGWKSVNCHEPIDARNRSSEPTQALSDQEWKEIAWAIRQGACVLVLGPAIAVDPEDPEHTPLTSTLAQSLAKQVRDQDPSLEIVNTSDLSHVSQVFSEVQALGGRRRLRIAVDEFYAQYDGKTTPLHQQLAELPFKLVINTTPNSFMETALNAVPNKALQLDYYELNHEHKLALKLDSKTPLLFDLYGNRQNIDSLDSNGKRSARISNSHDQTRTSITATRT